MFNISSSPLYSILSAISQVTDEFVGCRCGVWPKVIESLCGSQRSTRGAGWSTSQRRTMVNGGQWQSTRVSGSQQKSTRAFGAQKSMEVNQSQQNKLVARELAEVNEGQREST